MNSPVAASGLSVKPAHPVRRFVHLLLSFFCWFLVIRTVALEPFGVLTGSMAPAFLGIHREMSCPRCGYPIRVGEPGPNSRGVRFSNCKCPNCGQEADLSKLPPILGDRLMVDKTAFQLRQPRRWEPAVFRCPADLSKPYVKRVIGLPGEEVSLNDGDVFINSELARKSLAQVRELAILVHDSTFAPAEGWLDRWEEEPLADPKLPMMTRPTGKPLAPDMLRNGSLILDGQTKPEGVGVVYKHVNLDTHREEAITEWQPFNGGPNGPRDSFGKRTADGENVHDFMVQFQLEVLGGSGRFACRLADGGDTVLADIPIQQLHQPVQVAQDGGQRTNGQELLLSPGQRYFVEFAFVDRRVSLAIDGVEVLPAVDLPVRRGRGGMARPVQFGCRGAIVALHQLKIYRDVHYLATGKAGTSWKLGADEYFFLGDNSANSDDSRTWKINNRPAPGVPLGNFLGKPFLIHQPMRAAEFRLNGQLKSFQTLDWSRIRWVR